MFYRIHHIPQILLLQINPWKVIYVEKNLKSLEHIKFVSCFFYQQEQKFFENGIFNLAERWEYINKKKGQYIID